MPLGCGCGSCAIRCVVALKKCILLDPQQDQCLFHLVPSSVALCWPTLETLYLEIVLLISSDNLLCYQCLFFDTPLRMMSSIAKVLSNVAVPEVVLGISYSLIYFLKFCYASICITRISRRSHNKVYITLVTV